MNGDQRVDSGDLEDAENPRLGGDDAQTAVFARQPAGCGEKHAHAGRVEERALGEVHDHGIGRRAELRERVLELRGRREVELPRDVHDRGTLRQLAPDVKIVLRGHGDRV